MRVRVISLRGSRLVDRRRVTLVLNGDHGPAEESRPEPGGAIQETPEGGRLGLDEAWEDVLRQQELLRKRAESKRQKAEDQETLWREFMETERREIVQRRNGQLARHLGEPLPGELPAALKQLAAHDQTQAQRGLVALMSGGNTVYKPLEDLQPEDMPARIAANRLRVTWLKERRDEWLGRGEAPA
jgi:hypothetical protein